MKTKTQVTPIVKASMHHAEAALILAIQVVDNVLDDDNCALDHPELVTAVMMFAGNAYTALTVRDGVDEIIEQRKSERYH
jgi:hypothetical protein